MRSTAVNRLLHGAPLSPQEREVAKELIPRLDIALAQQRTQAPTTLYRGRDFHYGLGDRPEHKVGEVLDQPGYVSTSTSRQVGMKFAKDAAMRRKGGIMYQIEVPTGVGAAQIGGNEKEVLLERGGQFLVQSVGKPDKNNVIVVKVQFKAQKGGR